MTTEKISQDEINQILWRACDTFRGTVDPAEYKNYILAMLFVKYISDVWRDCHAQLHAAMKQITDEGQGVVLYLHQEGRGIGLAAKLKAYVLQDQGRDTVEANEELGFKADQRDYGIGAQILVDLGLHKIRVLTNNPRKLVGLSGYHLEIAKDEQIWEPPKLISTELMSISVGV